MDARAVEQVAGALGLLVLLVPAMVSVAVTLPAAVAIVGGAAAVVGVVLCLIRSVSGSLQCRSVLDNVCETMWYFIITHHKPFTCC